MSSEIPPKADILTETSGAIYSKSCAALASKKGTRWETNRRLPDRFPADRAFLSRGCTRAAWRTRASAHRGTGGLALDPNFTMHRFRAHARRDNPIFLTSGERIVEGMRLAGVPEG
jgi:hypothetical protein